MSAPAPAFPKPVHITGWGLVTPLGLSAWQTFTALRQGRTLADRSQAFLDEGLCPEPVALVRALGAASISTHSAVDPAIDLAERAAREALTMAGIAPPQWAQMPCYLGVSKGAMVAWQREWTARYGRPTWHEPHGDQTSPPGISPTTLGPVGFMVWHLRRRLGLGPVFPVMGACASSLIALHQAAHHVSCHGNACDQSCADDHTPRRALVLSAEAALLPIFIHSYRRLGVMPPLEPGQYVARPLDQQRQGFMLSEQAAAVVVEADTGGPGTTGAPGAPGAHASTRTQLLAAAIAGEAYDVMRPAPNMPALRHVAGQLWRAGPIDVLHPHATGTLDNDAAELEVYHSLAGSAAAALPVYAAKGALGHGLGAAGLVALVLACMSGATRQTPPMPWLTAPINHDWPLGTAPQPLPAVSTHAVFAAGFGGHVAGAVVRCTGVQSSP